jgi:hypothetical protein
VQLLKESLAANIKGGIYDEKNAVKICTSVGFDY